MSKISNDGKEQLKVIKAALDSMFDKLDRVVFVPNGKKTPKNVDVGFDKVKVFDSVKDEFEAIAGIVASTDEWSEV